MVHAILIPEENKISIDIPENYIGKRIEVIAFEENEGTKSMNNQAMEKTFTILHVEKGNYKFNRDEANER